MIELALAMLIGGWGFWVATVIAEEKKDECPCVVLEELDKGESDVQRVQKKH